MAHSLTPAAPAAAPATATPISPTPKRNFHIPCLCFQRVWACHQRSSHQALDQRLVHRRTVTLGLAGAVLSLNVSNDRSVSAAAKRPPPPPPAEKKDPNVSGALAKLLASKKRKEAMKDAVAKLREKGKAIIKPSE